MRGRAGSVPIHSRVETYPRVRIRSGACMPGDPSPPESQLCHQFRVERVTVRQALSRPVFEGLILRQRGRAGVVADPRHRHL